MTQSLPDEVLASLRDRLLTRASEIDEAIIHFLAAPDADLASTIREAAHKLAGIAATLGYPEIGEAAAAVDAQGLSVPPDTAGLHHLDRLRTVVGMALGKLT